MTTYILDGGIKLGTVQFLVKMPFWGEIIKRVPKSARVLCVYAAIDPNRWTAEFRRERELMVEQMGTGLIELELGSNKAEELAEQIRRADAIYLRGGYSSDLIKSALMTMSKLGELFNGKIVAGSSAGAYALSRYYITTQGVIGKGLDIVPGKIIAHYTDERRADLESLKNYGEDLPVYAIKEGEYIIVER